METASCSESICFITNISLFLKIPGNTLAYWISDRLADIFSNNETVEAIAYPRQGLAKGDNSVFLRLWHEVRRDKISTDSPDKNEFDKSKKMYIPYNKGGSYRKWFGNLEYVIKFDPLNYAKLLTVGNHLPSRELYFKESITWSKVTTGGLSMRYIPQGSAFDVAGCSIFEKKESIRYLLALCNANVIQTLIRVLSQTMNYEVGTIKSLPVIISSEKQEEIETLSCNNIDISKTEWDSFETSWDFKKHPLI